MTNKEAVIYAIGVTGWQDGTVDKAITDLAIIPTDTYTADSSLKINGAALQVLKTMLAVASVQEGGYNITYSVEGIKARIADLEGQTGTSSAQPKIRNRSYLW